MILKFPGIIFVFVFFKRYLLIELLFCVLSATIELL